MNNIHKPIPKYGILAALTEVEPSTISKALQNLKRRKATSAKIDAFIQNGTWDLVPPSKAQNLVGCKWIFRIKCLLNGSILTSTKHD